MGQKVRQDWATSLAAVHGLMNLLEEEWAEADENTQQERIASVGAYSVITFHGSFRGLGVFLTDLQGLRKYLTETKELG